MDIIFEAGISVWLTIIGFKIFGYPIIKEGGGMFDYRLQTWLLSLANFAGMYGVIRYLGSMEALMVALLGGIGIGIVLWVMYFFVGIINSGSSTQEKKDWTVYIYTALAFISLLF